MSAQTVYSPELEIEAAITSMFTDILKALSTNNPQTFQKPRGRIEVLCALGPDRANHLADSEMTGLEMDVEDSWSVTVECQLITDADITVHDTYRAYFRYNISRFPALANGVTLLNHVAYGPVRHVGSTTLLKPQDGVYQTNMNYSFDISVHADAWAKLNQP